MPSRCEKHLFDNVCMFFKFYPRPLFTFQGKEGVIMLKILYSGPDDFDTVALDEFITEPGSNFDDEDDLEF